jgi:5-methylcytosine-specific restriction endonuclease McrBC regulatory subunit McrC
MSTIHLWDNSWHVSESTEGQKDSFGRKAVDLSECCASKGISPNNLRPLSQTTIGKLMTDEKNEVMVWPNSFNEGYEDLKDQFIFSITEENNTINSITTGNVVGFIGVGSGRSKTDIRIHSRFASSNDNDFFLYYMLEKVMAINTFSLSSSGKEPEVFDFLLFFFPRLLKDALSQGMYKKYVYHEYNNANIRGVVDVNRHIRLNIPANGKIAYRTREFSYDNSVTQLIRHTIEFIRRKQFGKAVLHNDPDTEGCVQQIIQATPTFQPQQRQAIINENLRPVVHPYYTKYAALQNLCLRILRYEKLSYGNDNNNKIHGLLIDAAWLWEEYIGQVLSDDTDIKHYTRKNSHYHLFIDKDGAFQKIIPDYYDGDRIVADAKYIPLNRSRDLDADRAAPIYYKTIMYMYRFNTEKGFLFHPVAQEEAKDKEVVVSDYTVEDRDTCHFYELGLVVADTAMNEKENNFYGIFRARMNNNERQFVRKVKEIIKLNI